MQLNRPKHLSLHILLQEGSLVIMILRLTSNIAESVILTYIKYEMSGEHQHFRWFQGTRSPVSSQELVLKQLAIRWAIEWPSDALSILVVNAAHVVKDLSSIVWKDRP